MTQRVFVHVSPRWADETTLTDWICRLPKGSEVLYVPEVDEEGVDALGELLSILGFGHTSVAAKEGELPAGEQLDAVLLFAAPKELLHAVPIAIKAHERGVRASLIAERRR